MLLASSVPTQGWPLFGIVIALLCVFAIAGLVARYRDAERAKKDET
jgi:hypothetical protein